MSTSSSGSTKAERVQILLELIESKGPIFKEDIDIALSNTFQCDNDSAFKRSVARDLGLLEKTAKVMAIPYDREGNEIHNEDRETYKFKWALADDINEIAGGKSFRENGVRIITGRITKDDIAVRKSKDKPSNSVVIRFPLVSNSEFIQIQNDSLPLAILISRSDKSTEKILEITRSIGKRNLIIDIKSLEISSLKNDTDLGHAIIKLQAGLFQIKDLSSTNGTKIWRLTSNQVEAVSKQLSKGAQTVKVGDIFNYNEIGMGEVCPPDELTPLDKASLIVFGDKYPIIIEST